MEGIWAKIRCLIEGEYDFIAEQCKLLSEEREAINFAFCMAFLDGLQMGLMYPTEALEVIKESGIKHAAGVNRIKEMIEESLGPGHPDLDKWQELALKLDSVKPMGVPDDSWLRRKQ